MKFNLLFFLLQIMLLILCLTSNHTFFSSISFIVSGFIFRSNDSFQVNVCIQCEIQVKGHCLVYRFSVPLAPFTGKKLLSPLNCLCTSFQKSVNCIFTSLILDSLFHQSACLSLPVLHCLDSATLKCPQIRWCESYNFVLLLKNCLVELIYLYFHDILESACRFLL